jgi:hypothetical protein
MRHIITTTPATAVASARCPAWGMASQRRRAHRIVGALVCLAGLALAACSSGPRPFDRTIEGNFTDGTPRLQLDNSPYVDYPFEADAGWQVTIDMMSDELDAFLYLMNANGETLASDDDGGTGLNARIRYTVPARGSYVARANSYDSSDRGAYTVRIQAGPAQ